MTCPSRSMLWVRDVLAMFYHFLSVINGVLHLISNKVIVNISHERKKNKNVLYICVSSKSGIKQIGKVSWSFWTFVVMSRSTVHIAYTELVLLDYVFNLIFDPLTLKLCPNDHVCKKKTFVSPSIRFFLFNLCQFCSHQHHEELWLTLAWTLKR